MLNNYLENALKFCFKSLFIWPKLGIPSHLCDLRLSVSSACSLVVESSCFSRNHLLMELVHTHTHTLDLICIRPLYLKQKLP